MSESALEFVLKRDRMMVATALVLLTVLAWGYVVWIAHAMAMSAPRSMLDMPGMAAMPAGGTAATLLFTFAMWAVMMIGMMIPSAAPMILIYAQAGRQAQVSGKPLAATGWFAGGYVLAWGGFALMATLAQAELQRLSLVTPMLVGASPPFAGTLLIAAGIFQWTPVKDACLALCQSPLGFLLRAGGFRRDFWGSLKLGLRHGLYCIGCCWALMTLLFVGGVMNVLWIAALSILVLTEKVTPFGGLIARAAGFALIVAGIIILGRMV